MFVCERARGGPGRQSSGRTQSVGPGGSAFPPGLRLRPALLGPAPCAPNVGPAPSMASGEGRSPRPWSCAPTVRTVKCASFRFDLSVSVCVSDSDSPAPEGRRGGPFPPVSAGVRSGHGGPWAALLWDSKCSKLCSLKSTFFSNSFSFLFPVPRPPFPFCLNRLMYVSISKIYSWKPTFL